ncbi:hypothetical protein HHI36_017016 [Cryptolaemus montrouzieri]|uniref:Uncharacterized protein n=1 Tax=Cryptolaemus montrouzieri TaxID=559131 RepID=A0ABD2NM38_9CUCU
MMGEKLENRSVKELIVEITKIRTTATKIEQVERENAELREKIEKLERDTRKRNVVIFGLDKAESDFSYEFVRDSLASLFKVEIENSDVSDFYPLGIHQSR